ncbi:MAG: hypothetical protein ACQEQM_00130 [Thermoplasmatota archaeon]
MEDDPDINYDWSMEMMARYPFLEDSKRYIKHQGPSLNELVEDRVWDMVRIRGKERIMQAIEHGEINEVPMSDDLDMEMELFSYPIARILVSCVDDNYLTNRYALGESEKFLNILSEEPLENTMNIGEELGIEGAAENDQIKVYFIDYLENTEHLKSTQWKLTNQDLRHGYIYLDIDKYRRLLKESLFQRIVKELPRPVNDELLDIFSSQIKEIEKFLQEKRKDYGEVEFGEVDSEKFPPCIKKMLGLQKEGVNLSHEARFAMTSFLHNIGLSVDEILSLFSESPDFREDLALYQIEHITGEISGTEYTMPSCSTMRTNGICFEPDDLCSAEWMKHPLTYYAYKKKKDFKKQNKTDDEE